VTLSLLERILTRGECFEPVNVPEDLKIIGVRNAPAWSTTPNAIEVWCESAHFVDDADADLTPELNSLGLPELHPMFAPQYRRRCALPPLT
jgi:hypothetical protein